MKKTINFILASVIALFDRALLLRIPSQVNPPEQKASVKFGALLVGLKGKVGGTVFQGSKTGYTIKNKPSGNFVKQIKWVFGKTYTQANWDMSYTNLLETAPGVISTDGSNSNSSGNFSAQNLIRQLSKAWGALESSDREAWNAAAPSFPFTNKWGEAYTGSGFQVFVSINSKLLPFNVPLQTLPPSASDGTLPDHTWNTINLNSESTADSFLQLEIPDGIASGAAVVATMHPPLSNGKLKVVFGGKGQIAIKTESPSTVELLPLYLNLFGTPIVGSTITVSVQVINLSNGHIIFTTAFQQLINSIDSADRVATAAGGIYNPVPDQYLPLTLSWTHSGFTFDFGSIAVDHESDLNGWQLRLLQLQPNEVVTFTKGGTNPVVFYIASGINVVPDSGSLTLTANASGYLNASPLLAQFEPDTTGVKSCTLTVSAVSLAAPLVYTFQGTAI